MTTTPTTSQNARLPQLGQAVSRLLDAIADYQRDGYVTYQSTSLGRWVCGEHRCGSGAIDTADRNHLVTVEVAGPTMKTLTLTPAGRRHVRARLARKAGA